jgi:hypothetical protein
MQPIKIFFRLYVFPDFITFPLVILRYVYTQEKTGQAASVLLLLTRVMENTEK